MADSAQNALQQDSAFQAVPVRFNNVLYNCLICTMNFSSCENLALHLQIHGSILNMTALRGEYNLETKTAAYTTYLTSNTGVETFNCLICTEKFSSCTALTKHLHSHSGLEKFGCKLRVCAQNRPNSVKLSSLIDNSSQKTSTSYTESSIKHATVNSKRHTRINKKEEIAEIISSTGTSKIDVINSVHRKKLFCKTCGKHFEDIGVFLVHTKAHVRAKISKNNTVAKAAVTHNGNSSNHEIDKMSFMQNTDMSSEHDEFDFCEMPTSSSEKEIDQKSVSEENRPTKLTSIVEENISDSEVFRNDDDTHPNSNGIVNGGVIKRSYQCSMRSQLQVDKDNSNSRKSFKENQHNIETNSIEEFVCVICSRLFGNNADLTLHIKSHTNGCKIYDCLICGKPFPYWEDLTLHLSCHTDSAKFDCENCCSTFFSSDDFMQHMSTHSKDDAEPFICELCGIEFSRRIDVIQHMSVHTLLKNYICKTCGKSFTRRHSLTRHMYTHTAVETFICQICGKGFSEKCDLTSHLDTHTGVMRYKCGICNEPFTSTIHLSSHMYIHGDLKSYGCVTCGKVFNRLPDLKRHIIIHSRIKKYKCKICSVYFSHKSNWRRHEKNYH